MIAAFQRITLAFTRIYTAITENSDVREEADIGK